jgi:hypothetical protein
MKVALCLSGQPRHAIKAFKFIKKNIIEVNDTDVFLHINFDENNTYIEKSHKDNGVCNAPKNICEQLIKLYNPKKVMVEKQKEFKNPNIKIDEIRTNNLINMNKKQNWNKKQANEHDIKCVYSMFYGIYKCNELKEMYALENGFVYDYVIRLRFDVYPNRPLKCSDYDPNYIYTFDGKCSDEIIHDWINFGSNIVMNIYSSMFLNLEYINSYRFYKKEDRLVENKIYNIEEGVYGPEHMIRDLMKLFKIERKFFDADVKIC